MSTAHLIEVLPEPLPATLSLREAARRAAESASAAQRPAGGGRGLLGRWLGA